MMMMTMMRGNARNNSNNNNRNSSIRYPFTVSQWEELEQQALVFKYMVSGIPIPPDLLFTIHSSLSSKLLFGFQEGLGRKVDMEPGRCRRTDGKKWRCSKDAHPDSKYCQRHMHRGRHPSMTNPPLETHHHHPHNNNNIQPATSKNKTTSIPSHSFLYNQHYAASPSQQTTNFNFLNPDCRREGPVSSSTNCCRVPLDLLDGQEKQQQKKKKVTMHHFLDKWPSPKDKDATNWPNNIDDQSTPKLLHDFFMTKKC